MQIMQKDLESVQVYTKLQISVLISEKTKDFSYQRRYSLPKRNNTKLEWLRQNSDCVKGKLIIFIKSA